MASDSAVSILIIDPRCCAHLITCHGRSFLQGLRPARRSRAVLVLLLYVLNLCAAGLGLVYQWSDVSSFFLGVVISNFLVYFVFYCTMKVFVVGETLRMTPLLSFIIAILFWAPALYFFTRGLTSWTDTPAVSREGNAPCMLLDFFDSHDVWHMLSAGGLFFGCVMMLSLDDDLADVPRSQIPVF